MIRKWIFLSLVLSCIAPIAFATPTNSHPAKHYSHKHHRAHAHRSAQQHRQPIYHATHHGRRHHHVHHRKLTLSKNKKVLAQSTSTITHQNAMLSTSANANHHHWHNPHLIKHSIQFANVTSEHLVALVRETVSTLRYSAYKLGGNYFNAHKGIYEVDCSSYVDAVLHQADPRAYISLIDLTHTPKPTSLDYYNLFSDLPDKTWNNWHKVDTIPQLQPGAILVFRYKDLAGKRAAGHVMVVMAKPTPASADTYLVRVADSAPAGHSFDTRPRHRSGIGIGTLLLKVDPTTQQPNAYAWSINARWENDMDYAMAVPINS